MKIDVTTLAPFALLIPVAIFYIWLKLKSGSTGKTGSKAFAGARNISYHTPRQIQKSAKRLRNLPDKHPHPEECGVLLGKLLPRGPNLRASWEDTILAIMGPRAGHKTTGLAIPAVIQAPGPVIATANKTDLWAATAELREGEDNETWTFDPQNITHTKQTWWWNPLRNVVDIEAADRLAGMFVNTVDDDKNRDIWGPAARNLLTALFLAARNDDPPRTLYDVWGWLSDAATPIPTEILHRTGPKAVAQLFDGIQNDHYKTRSSVYFTARTAARCLADEKIMRWVTPPNETYFDEFDPTTFINSRDTLHMLSKDGGGSAAPLVAAFTDCIFTAAIKASEKRIGGRLDPPLIAVLDEAANICRIGDLPLLYSHFGSRGIIPITILQSYSQATRVWGHNGAKDLFAASTAILVGAGNNDAGFLEDISKLLGEKERPNTTYGTSGGKTNRSYGPPREDRLMSPGVIRALERGHALLVVPGSKPALIRLVPWHATKHKEIIFAAIQNAQRGIVERTRKPDHV